MNEPQRPRFPARVDLGGSLPVPAAPRASAPRPPVPAPTLPVPSIQVPTVSGEQAAPRQRMLHLLAQQGITDLDVLRAMGKVERHRFVDPALGGQAYEDTSLPIGLGQTISKPGVVARMLALLREGREGKLGRVLEVGTGCGYQAAVLSELTTEVYSMERLRAMHANDARLEAAKVGLTSASQRLASAWAMVSASASISGSVSQTVTG